jgi:hypothetical protein
VRAIDALLEGLVDYAGLFPPARLPMEEATRAYASYRSGGERSVLSAFVVPVARVHEMLAVAEGAKPEDPWPVNLLWTRGVDVDAPATEELRGEPGRLEVVAIEARAESTSDLRSLAEAAAGIPVFVEFSWREDPRPWVEELQRRGLRAKIRTGGVQAEMIPPVERVATFLEACHEAGLRFKATAGLHHPVRGAQNLTYDPDPERAVMHGFLNLFLGALFLRAGRIDASDLRTLLEDSDPGSFQAEGGRLGWRGRWATPEEIRQFRRDFACSFGSCSFTEPLEDLRHLELR